MASLDVRDTRTRRICLTHKRRYLPRRGAGGNLMQSPGNRIVCRSADMPACGSRDGLVGIGDCNGVGDGTDHGQVVIGIAKYGHLVGRQVQSARQLQRGATLVPTCWKNVEQAHTIVGKHEREFRHLSGNALA